MRQFTNMFVLSFLIPLLALGCASNTPARWQAIPQRNAGNLPPFTPIGLAVVNTNAQISVPTGPGKGAGAGKGALNAISAMPGLEGLTRDSSTVAPFGVVIVAPILAVGAIGGAIYGGVKAPSKKSQRIAAEQTISGIKRANVSRRVLAAIAAESRTYLGTNLVVMSLPETNANPTAVYLQNNLTNVLEIDFLKIGLTHEGAPEKQDRFFLEARSVLRDVATGEISHQMWWRYLGMPSVYAYGGEPYAISESEKLARLLAQDLCEELFLKALPENSGEFYGIGALAPKQSSAAAFWTQSFPKADSRNPTLKWAAYTPAAELGPISNLTYELKVWQQAPGPYPPTLLYHKQGLTDCEHRIVQLLAGDEYFRWSVRAHFTRNGRPAVSSWGMLRPLAHTHPVAGDRWPGPLRDDLLYRFKTPKK